MKKLLYILSLLIIAMPNIIGQTYYYKQVKIIDASKQIHKGDNTGQFITFTNQGCYDSDYEGYDIGNGFQKLLKNTEKIHVYYGDSYWGKAYFYVTSDRNRINIKVRNTGKIFVYQRMKAPSNTYTSTYINSQTPNTIGIYPVPIIDSDNNRSISDKQKHLVRETCSFCKGTGRSPIKIYSPDYTGGEIIRLSYCSICGKYEKSHSHGTCESCLGKGYVEKYK